MIRILWGQDEFSLSETLEKIKKSMGDKALLEMNTTMLDGQTLTPEQLEPVCNSVPFLAEKRLVIINGLLTRFNPKEKSSQPKKDNQQANNLYKQFADRINAIPVSTALVLVDNSKLLSTNPLFKALAPKAEVKSFPAKQSSEIQRWIQERVTSGGGRITTGATRILAQLVGGNLRNMANEIQKLILFATGRSINEQDVRAVVSESHEFNIFAMIDAIFEVKAGLAEQILQQMLERGVEPGHIMAMLSRQVRIIILTKELKSQKKSEAEIREKLGISQEFVWRKILPQTGRYSQERLKHFYLKLLETDLAIKTGKYSEELALNMLVAELCESRML